MQRFLNSTWRNLVFTLPFLVLPNQTNTYEEIIEVLEKQTYDYVQEKVYLHLDKPYYAKGEDIWFKAYTVAGPNHTPTPLSENLYVELVNPFGVVVKRHTIYMNKGLGVGDFQLADSVATGEYTVRAFTNWMRNFNEDFFFNRQITVVDGSIDPGTSLGANSLLPAEIRFFPEGGNLIAGVPSRVAFEVKNTSIGQKGQIKNQEGQIISSFEIKKNGLGTFHLTPERDENYHAILEGSDEQFTLPTVLPEGLSLQVSNREDQVWVQVFASGKEDQENHAFLLAHTRGLVGFASKVEWLGQNALVKIPKANLTDGIVHLTLFDDQWRPHAERLVFKNTEDNIEVKLTRDRQAYTTRDSTTLRIKLTDDQDNPLTGFFSLAAIDAAQIDTTQYDENIISSLLLSSDLDEKISQPLQYMAKDEQQHLDLLLMTRGWRRFLWKDVLNDQFPELENSVEKGFHLTGNVIAAKSKKPLKKGKVKQIGSFQGIPSFAEAKIDSEGNFSIKGLYYYETDVLLQGETARGSENVVVSIDSATSQGFPNLVNVRSSIANNLKKNSVLEEFSKQDLKRDQLDEEYDRDNIVSYLEYKKKQDAADSAFDYKDGVRDLGEVVIEGQDNTLKQKIRRTLFPRGQSNYSIDFDDVMKYYRPVSAVHALMGRLPGYYVTTTGSGGFGIGEPIVTFGDAEAVFVVDGIPTAQTFVLGMPAGIIESAEVFGGAIYLWTREDGFYSEPMAWEKDWTLGSKTLPNYGYYRNKEFYAPNYGKKLPEHFKPDHRALIHWEPMIQTDENGEAEITFYNADLESTIQVRLEGIWEGGIPLAKTINYEVTKD